MAHRPKPARPAATRSVTGNGLSAPLAHIESLIDGGGQIMIGTMKPIVGSAVAHDGRKTLAMLKRKPGETVDQLLHRLDAAVAAANTTGTRVDEINKPKSDIRYEL